jgi:hypothetical protein
MSPSAAPSSSTLTTVEPLPMMVTSLFFAESGMLYSPFPRTTVEALFAIAFSSALWLAAPTPLITV